MRLYGCAEQGDKPYPVYLHPECDKSKEVARKLSGGLTPRALDESGEAAMPKGDAMRHLSVDMVASVDPRSRQ